MLNRKLRLPFTIKSYSLSLFHSRSEIDCPALEDFLHDDFEMLNQSRNNEDHLLVH